MAKKSRRARLSPAQRFVPTPGAPTATSEPESAPAPVVRPVSRSSASNVARLGRNPEDYTHIRADLQRIGILAGSILAILVALRLLVFR